MKDHTTPEHVNSALASLSALINAASEGDDTQTTPAASERAHRIGESTGWGKRYCGQAELTGSEWNAAYETAKPIVASGGIIAMVGNRGSGKTQMAAEIAKNGDWPNDEGRYIPAYGGGGGGKTYAKNALYRRAMDIFLDLREATKNHVQSSEKEVLARLANAGLLVVDEFQERGESEWENRIMKNLIDKRYAAERPTIIIANLTRKELFDALGASIIDRARENGKSIEFNWPSYR